MKTVAFALLFLCGTLLVSAHESMNTPASASHPGFFGTYNVVIKSFQVTTDGKSSRISWEIDPLEYDANCYLERSSDGITYNAVYSFVLKTGVNTSSSYSDKSVLPGTWFYRLHVTKTGFVPYLSNVISIRISAQESSSQMTVSNPFGNNITIRGQFAGGVMRVQLLDLSGRLRLVQLIEVEAHGKAISFPAGNLTRGMYILKLIDESSGKPVPVLTKTIYKNFD